MAQPMSGRPVGAVRLAKAMIAGLPVAPAMTPIDSSKGIRKINMQKIVVLAARSCVCALGH